ncbi:hypothetical protein D1007_46834 [Hordeum vulgare]|nr:hypothetical protein D1007_46834 [Hordeum vulgare]
MRVDPQILVKHLTVEATFDALHTDAATWLAALNNSWWCFLEGSDSAFNNDYELFSQRARVFLSSRANSYAR